MIDWGVWGVEGIGFSGGIGGERGHWVMGNFGRKGGGMDPRLDPRFGFLRFCRCKKWCHMSRLDQGHQRYKGGLKMGPSAHCRVLLHTATSDLDS